MVLQREVKGVGCRTVLATLTLKMLPGRALRDRYDNSHWGLLFEVGTLFSKWWAQGQVLSLQCLGLAGNGVQSCTTHERATWSSTWAQVWQDVLWPALGPRMRELRGSWVMWQPMQHGSEVTHLLPWSVSPEGAMMEDSPHVDTWPWQWPFLTSPLGTMGLTRLKSVYEMTAQGLGTWCSTNRTE